MCALHTFLSHCTSANSSSISHPQQPALRFEPWSSSTEETGLEEASSCASKSARDESSRDPKTKELVPLEPRDVLLGGVFFVLDESPIIRDSNASLSGWYVRKVKAGKLWEERE
jgi:hypothetical protein